MAKVNYEGLTKEQVLMALYNASKPQGLGFLHFTPEDMTEAEAKGMIEERKGDLWFDYVKGRVMKINLNSNDSTFDDCLYDRDNGDGAAQRAIDRLRESLNN